MKETVNAAGNAGAVVTINIKVAQLFGNMKVKNGNLYRKGEDVPFLTGVKRFCVEQGKKVIKMQTGEKLQFSSEWNACSKNIAVLGDLLILSLSELEVDSRYGLVKGEELMVVNLTSGQVIHSGVKAFARLDKKHHLIRRMSGEWMYCGS